jgi:DNA primase
MAITNRTLQSIKQAPLSKVIEALGGGLKRVGHEFLTQCPWHDDTNPSLTVNDQKGFCFCHVCRGGGDAISYIRQRKGLGMYDAAEMASNLLGVTFETDDESPEVAARRRAERQAALGKLKKEQDQFKKNWRDDRCNRVRQLWLDRGLTKEASAEFGIGYTPSGFFAGRITVPIHNHKGDLVGWTGRATKPEQNAKYKNSADSELFQKKTLVFNEPRALEAAREAGTLIFVEGHLDVVSMWQAGIRNVVAMQGTGAPEKFVLERLARVVKNMVLCFDGDAGGKKAAEQFISVGGPMAMKGELNINVVTLPEGKDPDEVLRSGESLYNYIASAPSWLDWVIDTWAADLDLDDGAMVTEVERRLKALIDQLQSKALRTRYIDKAARVLSADAKEAQKLAKSWGKKEFVIRQGSWSPREPLEVRTAVERRMLRIFVHKPELRDDLRPLLQHVQHPALRWLCERLRELEEYSTVDLTPHSVMAVVAVAEPHYMQQLRTLIRPNVIIDDSPGVIMHIRDIMRVVPKVPTNESDTNQPSEGGGSEALF